MEKSKGNYAQKYSEHTRKHTTKHTRTLVKYLYIKNDTHKT